PRRVPHWDAAFLNKTGTIPNGIGKINIACRSFEDISGTKRDHYSAVAPKCPAPRSHPIQFAIDVTVVLQPAADQTCNAVACEERSVEIAARLCAVEFQVGELLVVAAVEGLSLVCGPCQPPIAGDVVGLAGVISRIEIYPMNIVV